MPFQLLVLIAVIAALVASVVALGAVGSVSDRSDQMKRQVDVLNSVGVVDHDGLASGFLVE